MSDDTGTALLARAPRAAAIARRALAAGLDLTGVWLVGGAVRDAVLDVSGATDVDLAVEGAGVDFARLLASAIGGDVVAEHDFGTATVLARVASGSGELVRIDVASCRTERYAAPGVLPDVELGASIEADLARRDVSANAVALALAPGDDGAHAIVDPHGGIEDVRAGVLRVLHDASFVDDPTRLLRIARYAGRLGFRVDDHTRELAVAAVAGGALSTISADRLRAEFELVLAEPAWQALTLLSSWGVLDALEPRLDEALRPPLLLPAIDAACGDDSALHHRAWPLRLAALVRPLGDDAAAWLRWMGFASEVSGPVLEHVHVVEAIRTRREELREARNSELYLELGEVRDDSIALVALLLGDDDPAMLERLVAFAAAARDTRLAVRGEDVLAAGVPAGPRVGRILGVLFLRALDGEFADEAAQRRALAELATTMGEGD